MDIVSINEGHGFIITREKLYNRLSELASIKIKTEAERYEEQIASRQFWELGAVEGSLLRLSCIHIENKEATPLQNRIYRSAHENRPQGYGGELCVP